MDPLSSHSITIRHESLPFGDNYHAVFRSDQFACMFDNFFESSREMRVVDLERKKTLRTFKCESKEAIVAFSYPYIVTRIEGKLKIWDVSSSLADPIVINTHLKDIQRGAIQGKTIAIISTQFETSQPKYITIIRDFNKPDETMNLFVDDTIDGSTGLAIYKNYLIYSTYFGALKLVSLDDATDVKILNTVGDVNTYLEKLGKENVEEFRKNTAQSIVCEAETLAYTTESTLKIWNIASDSLQKEINTKKSYRLLSFEGRFVLGVTNKSAKIWDIINGNVIYKKEDAFPFAGNIPSLTLFKNKIYHVGRQDEKEDDIIIPQEEKSVLEKKDSDEKQEAAAEKPQKGRCLVS